LLTLKSSSDSIDNLSRSIANARVDLNPHQVDAALFAFRSPLSKGTILADEVGLGKTIEAGIVLSQKWAERRRKILLILPAKRAILHRKNALFYKTCRGARVGDLFMSLIHTCQLCGASPFDYLTELEQHAGELSAGPEQWMPWNYRETPAAAGTSPVLC
jgi:hypothetical protein